MKALIRLFTVVLSLHLLVDAQDAFANVYASQLKASNPDGSPFDGDFNDGTGAALSFILNDNASSVTIAIRELVSGTAVHEIALGALNRGPGSTVWDGTGAEPGKQYFFEVAAEQPNYSSTEWTIFYDSGGIGIFSRGCDIVRDMSSPLFGLIYAPNTGGPLEKGITIYNPDGSFHDPFLVAVDISNGGEIDWGAGTQSMLHGVFDEEQRYYLSAIDFGEIRRINLDYSVTTVVSGLTNPKGLYLAGTGADKVLYICADNQVVRAAIGTEDVFSGQVEIVGDFANASPRNVALDDDGFMYVSFRASNVLNSEGRGMNKYDISGALPVIDDDAVWFLSAGETYNVAEIEIDHGSDRATSIDDILYYSTRAGDGNTDDGVWRVEDINFPFPQVVALVDETKLYNDDSSNINDRAAIGLDAAGNIIFMENGIEHIFFLTPPGEGATNSFTTTGPDTITVGGMVSVKGPSGNTPSTFRLEQNYPNPFNPMTTIVYHLAEPGFTLVRIFNSLGEEVRTLVAENQIAGHYQFVWNGKDNQGKSLGSGVYVLTVTSGENKQSLRMTLIK